jgi:plastocyanin
MNKILPLIVIVALIIGGVFLFMDRSVAPTEQQSNGSEIEEGAIIETEDGLFQSDPIFVDKEFTVVGTNFAFSPSQLRVKRGETVRIWFENREGVHDWKIDELNISTDVIQVGDTQVIEFVADRAGIFEYYCSVGNHKALGMYGELIVE